MKLSLFSCLFLFFSLHFLFIVDQWLAICSELLERLKRKTWGVFLLRQYINYPAWHCKAMCMSTKILLKQILKHTHTQQKWSALFFALMGLKDRNEGPKCCKNHNSDCGEAFPIQSMQILSGDVTICRLQKEGLAPPDRSEKSTGDKSDNRKVWQLSNFGGSSDQIEVGLAFLLDLQPIQYQCWYIQHLTFNIWYSMFEI